jgi:hypothetical protein
VLCHRFSDLLQGNSCELTALASSLTAARLTSAFAAAATAGLSAATLPTASATGVRFTACAAAAAITRLCFLFFGYHHALDFSNMDQAKQRSGCNVSKAVIRDYVRG